MNECARGVLSCLCCVIIVQIIAIAVQAAQERDVSQQVGSLVVVILFACCINKVAGGGDDDDGHHSVVVVQREPETTDRQVNLVSGLLQILQEAKVLTCEHWTGIGKPSCKTSFSAHEFLQPTLCSQGLPLRYRSS